MIATYRAEAHFARRRMVNRRHWISAPAAKALVLRHAPDATVTFARRGRGKSWAHHTNRRVHLRRGRLVYEDGGFGVWAHEDVSALHAMHEAAHLVGPLNACHGPEFRDVMVRIVRVEWGDCYADWLTADYQAASRKDRP